MTYQPILRATVRSPIHTLSVISPKPVQSILKKSTPLPLPLSPKPLSRSTFSIIISSPHPSPHVHFPSSSALASTFTVYSPNTYDRGPIVVSSSLESPGLKGWANRQSQLSPSASNAFKLLDAPRGRQPKPKKTQNRDKDENGGRNTQLINVPTLEDPRSPKPYKTKEARKTLTPRTQYLSVPTLEDPRSPKPYKSRRASGARGLKVSSVAAPEALRSPKLYKEVHNTSATTPTSTQLLSVPALGDPRSPKPYKPCLGSDVGVMFQETSLPVPRGGGELGRALVTYPRSPYPSAPIEGDENDMPMHANIYMRANTNIGRGINKDVDTNINMDMNTERGRSSTKSTSTSKPTKSSTRSLRVQLPSRARSLENESTTKSKYKPKSKPLYRLPNLPHTFSPLGLSFLTPVTESASASASVHLNAKPKSTPAPLDLEMQFWESVTLEEASEVESAYVTASSSLGASADVLSPSPAPSVNLMFGSKEGGVWSPRVPAWNVNLRGADIGCILSPSQRKAFRKGMVASPSPNDPFAAFPSFTVAMMSGVVDIAVPPRARVAREV